MSDLNVPYVEACTEVSLKDLHGLQQSIRNIQRNLRDVRGANTAIFQLDLVFDQVGRLVMPSLPGVE